MNNTKSLKEEALRRHVAAERAKVRSRTARWDLDIVVFLFAILALIIILAAENIELEIVAPIAVVGLALCWFAGWRRGKQLYEVFYHEELSKLRQGNEYETQST